MRKIEDLKPNECIHIRTKKEAKKLFKLANFKPSFPLKSYRNGCFAVNNLGSEVCWNPDKFSTILKASDFIKPSKLKDIQTELTRLDNRVRELEVKEIHVVDYETFNLKEIHDAWYINDSKCLVYVQNNKIIYGFSLKHTWFNKEASLDGTEKPVSVEQVQTYLINEAKKRGFKEGVKVNRSMFNDVISDNVIIGSISKNPEYKYFEHQNQLEYGHYCIFDKGIWAEIVTPASEAIDWNKPGQLFEAISDGCVILSSDDTNLKQMKGIIVYSTTKEYPVGCFKAGWLKSDLKLYTGEPITLSN